MEAIFQTTKLPTSLIEIILLYYAPILALSNNTLYFYDGKTLSKIRILRSEERDVKFMRILYTKELGICFVSNKNQVYIFDNDNNLLKTCLEMSSNAELITMNNKTYIFENNKLYDIDLFCNTKLPIRKFDSKIHYSTFINYPKSNSLIEIGGYNEEMKNSTNLRIHDLTNGEYVISNMMAYQRKCNFGYCLVDSRLYIFGGTTINRADTSPDFEFNEDLCVVECFDIIEETKWLCKDMPYNSSNISCLLIDGNIHVKCRVKMVNIEEPTNSTNLTKQINNISDNFEPYLIYNIENNAWNEVLRDGRVIDDWINLE